MSETMKNEIQFPTIISSSAIISAVLSGVREATKSLNEKMETGDAPRFSLTVRKPYFGGGSKVEASICQEYGFVDMEAVSVDTSFRVTTPEHSPLWWMTLDMYELKRGGEPLHNLVKEIMGDVKFMFLGVDEARQYLYSVKNGVKQKVFDKALSTLEGTA